MLNMNKIWFMQVEWEIVINLKHHQANLLKIKDLYLRKFQLHLN